MAASQRFTDRSADRNEGGSGMGGVQMEALFEERTSRFMTFLDADVWTLVSCQTRSKALI